MTQGSKGLAKAKEVYEDRSRRVKELKAEGRKIIGYPCIYVPLEMMTALDLVPYRIYGDMREPITEADRGLQTAFCAIMRSCLDLGLKGKYDFLDGFVAAHSCDPQEKAVRVWASLIEHPYVHFLDVPGTLQAGSWQYFKGQLAALKKTLESFTGKIITQTRLREAIEAHNLQRALVRELYDLRKPDPPLISGAETLQVVKALTSIPVEEGNELLRQVITEVKKRKNGPQKKPARLLVWGNTMDDIAHVETIEGDEANIVMDDHCGGSRAYRTDVELTEDLLDGLTDYYLVKLIPPRTFRVAVLGETKKDWAADLESRFGYIGEYIKGWDVNGVIMQLVRYCDPHGFEQPAIKDYFDSLGIPNTYLEHDYSEGALAPLRTRVQGFLEVIGPKA
jgi:bcr-type benzoyl-CoA reductase subunit C